MQLVITVEAFQSVNKISPNTPAFVMSYNVQVDIGLPEPCVSDKTGFHSGKRRQGSVPQHQVCFFSPLQNLNSHDDPNGITV